MASNLFLGFIRHLLTANFPHVLRIFQQDLEYYQIIMKLNLMMIVEGYNKHIR